MNAMKQEAPERQEIEELLPWHAAGTLSRRDSQRVEEALAREDVYWLHPVPRDYDHPIRRRVREHYAGYGESS